MATINCPDCGNEVAADAVACPNCGRPIAKRAAESESRGVDWYRILLAVCVISTAGCFLGFFAWRKGKERDEAPPVAQVVVTPPAPKLEAVAEPVAAPAVTAPEPKVEAPPADVEVAIDPIEQAFRRARREKTIERVEYENYWPVAYIGTGFAGLSSNNQRDLLKMVLRVAQRRAGKKSSPTSVSLRHADTNVEAGRYSMEHGVDLFE